MHAFVIGISWFVVGLPAVLAVTAAPALAEPFVAAVGNAPRWLNVGMAAVAALFAFPYLWPAYMALGGLEVRCASRMRAGDERAGQSAARLLVAQAACFALLGVALALWLGAPAFGAVPVTIALLHVWLAEWMRRAPPTQA